MWERRGRELLSLSLSSFLRQKPFRPSDMLINNSSNGEGERDTVRKRKKEKEKQVAEKREKRSIAGNLVEVRWLATRKGTLF